MRCHVLGGLACPKARSPEPQTLETEAPNPLLKGSGVVLCGFITLRSLFIARVTPLVTST